MNHRLLRGCAVLAFCFAVPCAQAATLTLTGSGSTENGSGTASFGVRTNEEFGGTTLWLSDGPLVFWYDWQSDWLAIGFEFPDGTWTGVMTAHRTVPFRTSPSTGTTTGTHNMTLGDFSASLNFSSNDFLVTGSVVWQFGGGATVQTPASVPEGTIHVAYIGAALGMLVLVHRRKR